jgi:MFS family permease
MTGLGAESEGWVVAGLIFLGLGWSASTVAGSALLTDAAAPDRRPIVQGRSDLLMSASGALGGALAGVVLALAGYSGLSFATLALVAIVVAALLLVERPHGGPGSAP